MAYTYDQVMAALRNADASGNVEDAKKLAQIANSMRKQETPVDTKTPQAPQDTSFSSALQSGLDAPLENLGQTAKMLGAEGVGNFLSNATEAPKDYAPAQVVDQGSDKPWYDPRAYNWSQLPRAAVEQAGQLAGSLASRAGGAAVGGAVAGPAGAAVGAFAAPAIFEGLQVIGPTAKKLAEAKGLASPGPAEWAQAANTAAINGALNGLIPDAKMLRPFTEALTEAAQSVNEQSGATAGTPGGEKVDPKQAVAEGLAGGTAAAGAPVVQHPVETLKLAGKAAAAPVTLPVQLIRNRVIGNDMRTQLKDDPQRFESALRIMQAFDEERAGLPEGDPQMDTKAINNLWERHKSAVGSVIDGLYDNRQISQQDKEVLDGVYKLAATRTKEFNPDLDISRILSVGGIDSDTKDLLVRSMYDLNTLSTDSMLQRRIGPAEEVARRIDKPVGQAILSGLGGMAGTALMPGYGTAAGAAAGVLIDTAGPKIGRAIDRFLENQEPPVLRGRDIRTKVAEKAGVDSSPVLGQLEKMSRDLYGNMSNVVSLPRNYLVMHQRSNHYKAKAAEVAQARALEREHQALITKTQQELAEWGAAEKAEPTDDGAMSIHDPKITAAASRGVFQFRMQEAKKRLAEAEKAAREKALEAKKLEDDAKATESEAQKWEALMNGDDDVPLGGWKASALEWANKLSPGTNVTHWDLKEALQQIVNEGLLTEEDAKAAWYVPGAKLSGDPKFGQPYYKVQDRAARVAAERQGLSFSWDANQDRAREAAKAAKVQKAVDQQKQAAEVQARMELEHEKASQALPAMGAMIMARTMSPEQLQDAQGQYEALQAKAKEAAAKAAATRKLRQSEPKETKVVATSAKAKLSKKEDSYKSTVETAGELKEAAVKSAPNDDLASYARSIAGTKYRETKKALYLSALEKHPDHKDWIVSHLQVLSQTGGISRGK